MFTQQLKKVTTMAMDEALNFIKKQSVAISKHLTKEHRKLIDGYRVIKESTTAKLARLDILEKLNDEADRRWAIESATKEANYALDK